MPVNILLLRPFSTIQKVIPIGLLYLSAYLKKACPQVKVKLVDFRLHPEKPYARIEDDLEGFIPDIIGISSLSLELMEAIALARQCRTVFPESQLVLGGPASSSDYDVIAPLDVFDRIVVGEGEEIFKGLVNQSIDHASKVLYASDHPAVDVDYVDMPDYPLINLSDYFLRGSSHEAFQTHKRYVPIFTSRGCPFDCGFCFHIFGKTVRFRDIGNVCNEVDFLVQNYGIREIHIEDDVFNLKTDRVKHFFAHLIKENLRLAVSFPNGIIYTNIDADLVRTFKAAGVYRVSLGIESTSPRIMELISKKHDLQKLAEAIRLFDKYRILTHGFLITGFPTETEQDLEATVRFVEKSRLHTFRFGHYVPFRRTPLYEHFSYLFNEQGLDNAASARYRDGQIYSDISAEVTRDKVRSLSLRFYLNPGRIGRIVAAMNKKVMLLFILRKTKYYLAKLVGKADSPVAAVGSGQH